MLISRPAFYNILLVVLIILEDMLLFFTHGKWELTSQGANAISLFLISIAIGVVVLLRFYGSARLEPNTGQPGKTKYFVAIGVVAGMVVLNMLTIDIMKENTYLGFSDIIPCIQTMARLFNEGLYPYAPAPFQAVGMAGGPVYFSMHWLPYIVSDHFQFDPRTVTFSIWAIGASLLMYRALQCNGTGLKILTPLLMMGCYWSVATGSPPVIYATIETMVAGYYMLFMTGLNQKNIYVTALFIAVCLLSRYFVVLWLPLWGFTMLASGNKMQLLKASVVIAVCVSVLFVIPFLSKDWSFLSHAFSGYKGMDEWRHVDAVGRPYHLYNGTGFAYLFYEHCLNGDMEVSYQWLCRSMFIVPLAGCAVMGAWYWKNRAMIDHRIFLMASFKIYLALFTSFLIVPYLYLSVTTIFVSVALFAEQARYLPDRKKAT